MSLSGTFETLPVAAVLGLLAGSKKTGALRLEADELRATLYMRDGRCQAVEGGGYEGASPSREDLERRLVDVCFEVARLERGTFEFDAGTEPPHDAPEPVEIASATAQLEELLEQWESVKEVIPSLDHQPRLHATLTVDMLELDAERWKLVVAVDGRRTVRQIVHKLNARVIDVCRELAALIEVGAVRMSKTPRTAAFAEPDAGDRDEERYAGGPVRSLIVPSRPYGPGVDDADPHAATPAPSADGDMVAAAPEAPAPPVEVFDQDIDDGDGVHTETRGADDDDGTAHADDGESDAEDALAASPGGPRDGVDDDRGDADDVAAAVEALKERGELPADATAEEVRDRGALLRLFSALRDS